MNLLLPEAAAAASGPSAKPTQRGLGGTLDRSLRRPGQASREQEQRRSSEQQFQLYSATRSQYEESCQSAISPHHQALLCSTT
mmetsp:Transcript_137349/g.342528  ORF Transcript_137349/g.342528 Transcript_137349/m.342528 type:complete len:83 (-) Transcript_137349:2600-2848(-)